MNGRNGMESYGRQMFSIVIIYVAVEMQNCNRVCSIELFGKNYVLRHFTAFIFVLNCIHIFKCKVMF